MAEAVDAAEPVFETSVPDVVGCERGVTPAGLEGGEVIVIRPPTSSRDCFSDFAVSLFLDDSGQVAGVHLQLASP